MSLKVKGLSSKENMFASLRKFKRILANGV